MCRSCSYFADGAIGGPQRTPLLAEKERRDGIVAETVGTGRGRIKRLDASPETGTAIGHQDSEQAQDARRERDNWVADGDGLEKDQNESGNADSGCRRGHVADNHGLVPKRKRIRHQITIYGDQAVRRAAARMSYCSSESPDYTVPPVSRSLEV